jgi:hypothetical protein
VIFITPPEARANLLFGKLALLHQSYRDFANSLSEIRSINWNSLFRCNITPVRIRFKACNSSQIQTSLTPVATLK